MAFSVTAIGACLEVLARPDGRGTAAAAAGLQILWDALPKLPANPLDSPLRQAALARVPRRQGTEVAGPGPAQILAWEDLGARFRCDHGALMACLVPKAVAWTDLDGRFPSMCTPFSTIEDFAQSLTLPTRLADLCAACPPMWPMLRTRQSPSDTRGRGMTTTRTSHSNSPSRQDCR